MNPLLSLFDYTQCQGCPPKVRGVLLAGITCTGLADVEEVPCLKVLRLCQIYVARRKQMENPTDRSCILLHSKIPSAHQN